MDSLSLHVEPQRLLCTIYLCMLIKYLILSSDPFIWIMFIICICIPDVDSLLKILNFVSLNLNLIPQLVKNLFGLLTDWRTEQLYKSVLRLRPYKQGPKYLRFIFNEILSPTYTSTYSNFSAVLEDELENCRQLLELEPGSKWPLYTQVIATFPSL